MNKRTTSLEATPKRIPWLAHEGLRLFLGCVFLSAAAFKLSDLRAFQTALGDLEWLPGPLARVFGLWIPGLECVLAICLICGVGLCEAGTITVVLLAVFVGAAVYEVGAGIEAHGCACFKGSDQSWFGNGIGKVVRNAGLFAAGSLFLALNARLGQDSQLSPTAPATESA